MDGPTFFVLQFAILLSIGLFAARRLALDLRLGPVASLTFLAIFLMNGHLIAHLETGHLQWVGYVLLPGVFLFVHRAATGDFSRRTQAGLALTLALVELVGGWHVFVWCVIWIGVFIALDRSRWRFGASLSLLVAGLSALRVVAALWGPSVAMLVLSAYNIDAWTLFRLPGFESQRVATRLLVVAVLGFALIACVQLDASLARRPLSRWRAGALALAGLVLAAQLVAHANSRRPRPDRGAGVPAHAVVSDRRPEAAYAASVFAGAAITLASAGFAFVMWRHEH